MKELKPELIRLSKTDRLYGVDHPVIGLTGGIATGKSTVAKLFQDLGIPVVSADTLVKEVYKMPEALDFVKKHWPTTIIEETIRFDLLRKVAFSDDKNRELIEGFIYSKMKIAFDKFYSNLDDPSLLVYDVPLLFEKKLESKVDLSICVYTSRDIQIQRLLKRDSIDNELAEKILNAQWDIEEKKKAADYLIDNSGSLDDLKKQFDQCLKLLVQA
ncbi:MAG: dephospho-CoA kinase [Bacteriovoracaceae bacterium]|jgi:dephospho-CoA kinase